MAVESIQSNRELPRVSPLRVSRSENLPHNPRLPCSWSKVQCVSLRARNYDKGAPVTISGKLCIFHRCPSPTCLGDTLVGDGRPWPLSDSNGRALSTGFDDPGCILLRHDWARSGADAWLIWYTTHQLCDECLRKTIDSSLPMLIICSPLLLYLWALLDSKTCSCSSTHILVCMHENVSFFPLQLPLLASPHPLPAIYRANLKLHYYDSCTWCVGGRFRTSTPSINPPMGPTSWLNRPVPLLDNLSCVEAKLRSCNHSKKLSPLSLSAR